MEKTKVIRVYETFAGIGAQHKALTNIDKDKKYFKVVQTSEWDARAIIAYAQIHHQAKFNKKLKEVAKWDEQKVNKYFLDKTFSLNSKVPGHLIRKPFDFKINLIAANEVNNNIPDITKVNGKHLKNIDLVTYSFPCQGLSIANMGRDKGIKQDAKSTSNLIWQIRRMLLEAVEQKIKLPKYLLMENVKNLIGKKHKSDYDQWINFLNELGYSTNTLVINGLNHGSLQKRERVFAISVLREKNKMNDKEFKKMFEEKFSRKLSVTNRKRKYLNILISSSEEERLMARPNKTPSRIKMAKENHDLLKRPWLKGMEYTFNTLTTKQDRHPNIGMIDMSEYSNKKENILDKRFITPREAYQIMGFTSKDYEKVNKKFQENIVSKESLYRQAGNSIVVEVLEDLFRYIKEREYEI